MQIQSASLTGSVTTDGVLSGEVSVECALSGVATIPTVLRERVESYGGAYTVTPKVSEQVLETENKKMEQNLTVNKIPYYAVSNAFNGETIIIGAEV